MSGEPRQGIQTEVITNPDGSTEVRRSFTDYFGEDFDLYICRGLELTQVDDPEPEDPEVLEGILTHEAEVDASLEPPEDEHYFLQDVCEDGTVYLRRETDEDNEDEDSVN